MKSTLKKNEIEEKMQEIKLKETQINERISKLKNKGEIYKTQIHDCFEEIIQIAKKRKQLLIDQINQIISNQIQQCFGHIQHLQTCYQNLLAYSKKIEEMWNDNKFQLKEREEQIVKQSNVLLQQYIQLHYNYNDHISRHHCHVYFQKQSIIQELNQFGYVTDKYKRLCHLTTQVKTKTPQSITIVWKKHRTRK